MSKSKTVLLVSRTRSVRRNFSDEFKRDAVSLVTEQGYSLARAARSLDLHPNLIRKWKQKLMGTKKDSSSLTEDEKAELKRLRKENRELRTEKEILKKATIFFARENQ